MSSISEILCKEFNVKSFQIENVITMLDEGATVPFIARYRKERTGGLSDVTLREIYDRLKYLRNLSERKDTVLKSIEEQGKLNDELKGKILNSQTLTEVEDLYRPYKQKKRTRATIAVEKGLKPLAETILSGKTIEDIQVLASKYVNEEKGVANTEEALKGAQDIIAEKISDEAKFRKWIRELVKKEGIIQCKKSSKEEEPTPYEMYYDYSESIK